MRFQAGAALLLLVALAAATGCSRRAPAASPEPAVVESATAARPDSNDGADRVAADRAARERAAADSARTAREVAERDRAARDAERMRALRGAVYFEFDRSDLSLDAREVLDRKLELLRGDPSLRVAISGHADERGSDEYNLALGERRALAARRYLTQRGIDPARIETASFGEERPVCSEHDEPCWARNRRAELQIATGSVANAPPPD